MEFPETIESVVVKEEPCLAEQSKNDFTEQYTINYLDNSEDYLEQQKIEMMECKHDEDASDSSSAVSLLKRRVGDDRNEKHSDFKAGTGIPSTKKINLKRKYKKKIKWTQPAEELLVEEWEDKCDMLRGMRKNLHVYQEIADKLLTSGLSCNAEDVRAKLHNLTTKYKKERAMIGLSGESSSEWPMYAKVHRIIGHFKINNVESLIEENIDNTSDTPPLLIASTQAPSPLLTPTTQAPSPSLISLPKVPSPGTIPVPAEYPRPPRLTSTSDVLPSPSTAVSPPSPALTKSPTRKKARANFQQQLLKRFDNIEKEIKSQHIQLAVQDEKLFRIETVKAEAMTKIADNSEKLTNALLTFLENPNRK